LEVAVRNLSVSLILIGVLGFSGQALARDITLRKHTAAEIQSACEKAGGKFSQDAKGYGCGTDCHGGRGTDCTVFCPTGARCVVQVIGGRRPHDVAQALTKPERHQR
jgi:hypothetical protein